MDIPSPWSTPESTPLRISVVDCSTPFTENALIEMGTAFGWTTSPRLLRKFGSNGIQRTRRQSFIILLWTTVMTIALLWWLRYSEKQTILFQYNINRPSGPPTLDGLQFIDADHPYIQYVGRWTSTPDKTRKDGSFPGVYFDFAFNGSNTILVSLHNTDPSARPPASASKASKGLTVLGAANASYAKPISLLARVDDDEYIVLPNASSIVLIRKGNLEPHVRHEVRIIAPMFGGEVVETLQVEGIWIDEAGQLLSFETESTTKLQTTDATGLAYPGSHRKMLEIVTDFPGSMAGRDKKKNSQSKDILGGVAGWEYLLGEMFGVDHVTVGMDGMCLTQECIGGRGNPAGLADVFFQSGPFGSAQYSQPWLFEGYVPEVMVMNIGNADWDSFQRHNEEYNKTIWELSMVFEDTYVSLIRAIRTLAYPKYSLDSTQTVAGPPIFVMRPFRGQLETVTLSVVDRLRSEGDWSVFWLDTSGWLNTEVDFDGPVEDQDFFLDGTPLQMFILDPCLTTGLAGGSLKQWRLTERGNQRVAILLHMHVCRYLAKDMEKCAFLPPEFYHVESEEPGLDNLLEEDDD